MKLFLSFLFLFVFSISFSQGNDCNNATPICSDAAYTFPNVTNTSVPSGPDYGCLQDPNLLGVQNPTWYYMEIGQDGTLAIQLEQNSNDNPPQQIDADFAMWGPYNDLSSGCASVMSGSVPPIQCSSDPSNTEHIGIGVQGGGNYWSTQYSSSIDGTSTPPPAQAGQFYIVVVSNASNTSGNVTFQQTGGTGSTNCGIVEQCDITNMSATAVCNGTNATINGSMTVSTTLTTGTLTVTSSCGGSQTFNPPFPSTPTVMNFSIDGGPGDGSNCTVTAVFSDNSTCTATANVTKPYCTPSQCSIDNMTATAVCNGTNATINGSMTVSTTLTTGTLTVTSSCGGSQTFNPPFPSTPTVMNFSLDGGVGDGSNCTVTATFSDSTACTASTSVTKPTCGCNLTVTPASNNVCVGATTTFTANQTGGSWTSSDPSVATVNAGGVVTGIAYGVASITYTNGTCTATSQVSVNSLVTPTFLNPGPLCTGTAFTLPTTSQNGISGSWSPAVNDTLTTTYTFTPSGSGCFAPTTMQVVIQQQITPIFAPIDTICKGDTVILPTTSQNGLTGSWSPAFNNQQTTTYTFTPSGNAASCASSTTMTIYVKDFGANTSITSADSIVLEGNSTDLSVTMSPYIPGILYAWQPSSSLSCVDCPNPTATPTSDTWYSVELTNPNGCKTKDSILIKYQMNCGDVYVPNMFSPNGDGRNDTFLAFGKCLKSVELTVYDRWGQKLFFTTDPTEGWDGTFHGKEMNTGVYVYRLKGNLLYGGSIIMKGNVTLVR